MSQRHNISALNFFCVCLILVGSAFSQELTVRTSHFESSPQLSSSVISHQLLNPPLRGSATIRFSPDGRFLLLQDDAGLFILTREPLGVLRYIDAPDAYPARFSNDSETVSLLSNEFVLATWRLPDGKNIARRELRPPYGCLNAELAPGAQWIACLSPAMILDFYKSADLSLAFSQHVGILPNSGSPVPVRLNFQSAFSEPFGFTLSDSLNRLANRKVFRFPAVFSPDGSFVLLRTEQAPIRLSLPGFQKSNLPDLLHKQASGILSVFSADRVLLADKKPSSPLSLVSLTTGESIAALPPSLTSQGISSNPRYALVSKYDAVSTALFDLQEYKLLDLPPNLDVDIFADTLALFTSDGVLQFYHLGESQPFLRKRLPLNDLPRLRSALVDPSLSTLAVSHKDAGAIFDLTTGNRLASLPKFDGASFASPSSAFLIDSRDGSEPHSVSSWTTAKTADAAAFLRQWTSTSGSRLFPGSASFLEYSFLDAHPNRRFNIGVNLKLRGLDPSSGRELWKHSYGMDAPVPFDDPQGDRLVIGWPANSGSAYGIAKHFPSAKKAYKTQKAQDVDSFFEILDAAKGTTIGGVLVRFGSGPANFDSAFSCGNALFVTKDLYRVALFDLQTGLLVTRVRGQHPAASAEAKVFVVDEAGKLTFFDLASGAKLGDFKFPDNIAYTHFSEHGDRLLVLTSHQESYILDVKKTLLSFSPPATSAPEQPSE